MFRPFTGSSSGLYNNFESAVHNQIMYLVSKDLNVELIELLQ
jgi:hypothetical protein